MHRIPTEPAREPECSLPLCFPNMHPTLCIEDSKTAKGFFFFPPLINPTLIFHGARLSHLSHLKKKKSDIVETISLFPEVKETCPYLSDSSANRVMHVTIFCFLFLLSYLVSQLLGSINFIRLKVSASPCLHIFSIFRKKYKPSLA